MYDRQLVLGLSYRSTLMLDVFTTIPNICPYKYQTSFFST